MKPRVDRYGNEVFLGDIVVYASNKGLRVGIMIKMVGSSFTIRLFENGKTIHSDFCYNECLGKLDSILELTKKDVLKQSDSFAISLDQMHRGDVVEI